MQHIYTFTVPVFTKMLSGLKGVLAKAEAHAKEAGIGETVFLQDRLAPDMFPLVRQVQIATDNAKGAAARLTGTEAPKFEDVESTFAELQVRIDKTLTYLATVQESQFAGAEDRKIELPYFPGKYMTGMEYVVEHALPNFLFHITTAYALVRKNGTPVGKADFIGGLPLKDLA